MGFCSAVFSPNTSTLQRCLKKRSPGFPGRDEGVEFRGVGVEVGRLGFRNRFWVCALGIRIQGLGIRV